MLVRNWVIDFEHGINKKRDARFKKSDDDNSIVINDELFTMENGAHNSSNAVRTRDTK